MKLKSDLSPSFIYQLNDEFIKLMSSVSCPSLGIEEKVKQCSHHQIDPQKKTSQDLKSVIVSERARAKDLAELMENHHTEAVLNLFWSDKFESLLNHSVLEFLNKKNVNIGHDFVNQLKSSQELLITGKSTSKEASRLLSDYFEELRIFGNLKNRTLTIAEELISNCIFGAPRDEFGQVKYNHLSRLEDVTLAQNEFATLRFGYNDQFILIQSQDPFGSLRPSNIRSNIETRLSGNYDKTDLSSGGSLGLFQTFSFSDFLSIEVKKDCHTQITSILHRRKRKKYGNTCFVFRYF